MRIILSAFLLALLPACASGALTEASGLRTLEDAKVVSTTPPGIDSGVLMAFAEIKVSIHHQERVLVTPYGDARQVLPPIGSRCTFFYEVRDIEGAVGTTFATIRSANVIRRFECE